MGTCKILKFKNDKLQETHATIEISEKNIVYVMFSSITRSLIIITDMEIDIKFWRQLRLACGNYVIHNNDISSLLKTKKVNEERLIRYKHRNEMVNSLFIFIEKSIKIKNNTKK